MARTILDEVLGFRPDYIEHQLAHAVRNPNGRAYNRTAYLPERRKMMQEWADYLDKLKAGAEIIPINHKSTTNQPGASLGTHRACFGLRALQCLNESTGPDRESVEM